MLEKLDRSVTNLAQSYLRRKSKVVVTCSLSIEFYLLTICRTGYNPSPITHNLSSLCTHKLCAPTNKRTLIRSKNRIKLQICPRTILSYLDFPTFDFRPIYQMLIGQVGVVVLCRAVGSLRGCCGSRQSFRLAGG